MGWVQRKKGESTRDFGLYLDPQWRPTWPNVMLDWPDFGVPRDQATADDQIQAALVRARAGDRVEVACIGGHGRTGMMPMLCANRQWPRNTATLPGVHPLFVRAAVTWVPLAVAVTGVAALVYGALQQDLRQGANDPQIQMAEDAAARLNAGGVPSAVVPSETIELATALQPYVMVFDNDRNPIASNAQLNGQPPPFPPSVFDSARSRGQDRITWQPGAGVRSAVVVQPWRGGFVVVGRSLKLAEERIDQIRLLTEVAWLITLGATAVAAVAAAGAEKLM